MSPLQYAPPARGVGRRRPALVLAGGVVSGLVAVAGVYAAERFEDADPFAWHALFVLPVGSLLVAAVAASGILFATQWTHVRGRRPLAVSAAGLMVLAYVACLYAEFAPFHWVSRATGRPITFARFIHEHSVTWTWRVWSETVRLGLLGYGYRVVDLLMFAGAGAVAVELSGRTPYCDLCRTYLTRRRLAVFPASLPYQSMDGLSAEDRAEFQADQMEHKRAALEGAGLILTLADAGDLDAVRQAVDSVRPDRRAIARLPTRLALDLETCPGCRATTLRTALLVGKTARPLDGRPVSGEFADLR